MSRSSLTIANMLAIAVLAAVPIAGVQAATVTAKATAKVVKPLTFKAKQDLDFGQIILGGAGVKTVSLSGLGVLTCGAGLTCSGFVSPAILNVSGSNGQVVRISTAASDLVNPADGSRMRFVPSAPTSITLINSGSQGLDFRVGGSIAIPATATDGVYSGLVQVTVDYQ